MKELNPFQQTIADHLEKLAQTDLLFAQTLKKPNKNIEDCCNYIISEVQKSGRQGFADDEVFNMAIHYYDEDSIEKPKEVQARVVVNRTIEAPPKPKTAPIVSKPVPPSMPKKPTPKGKQTVNQMSMF